MGMGRLGVCIGHSVHIYTQAVKSNFEDCKLNGGKDLRMEADALAVGEAVIPSIRSIEVNRKR
jgi:hypothetical protein